MKDLEKMARLAVRAEYHSRAAGEKARMLKRNEGWGEGPVRRAGGKRWRRREGMRCDS